MEAEHGPESKTGFTDSEDPQDSHHLVGIDVSLYCLQDSAE
jgi:hypothetical protein